jgi:zinc transport system permease protein
LDFDGDTRVLLAFWEGPNDPIFLLVSIFERLFGPDSFFALHNNVRATLAIIVLSFVCGSLGSLVVGNRMAFFSDALAHIAFAGVAFGLLVALMAGAQSENFRHWITLIMVVFGVTVGLLIAWVQDKSGLPNDTVIGVFFAGALGLGAIFVRTIRGRQLFNLESFLFGDLLQLKTEDLLWLVILALLVLLFLLWFYNALVLASFNPSLARARRLPGRLARYVFVALLGLTVNLCQASVGVLLINGLLIVPAATASNVAGNMRQMFWMSVGLSLTCGLLGEWISWELRVSDPFGSREPLTFGLGGVILVLCVCVFFVSLWVRALREKRTGLPAKNEQAQA